MFSRQRFAEMNDIGGRLDRILGALNDCMLLNDTVCVNLSDGPQLAIACALMGARKVITLDSNSLSRKLTQQFAEANGIQVPEQLAILDPAKDLSKFVRNQEVS
jgi:hypothetical protein